MSGCVKHEITRRKPASATGYSETKLRVATIIKGQRKSLFSHVKPNWHQARVLDRISKCRTEEMRSHIWRCTGCHYEEVRYNSCQNRYCPSCYTIPRALRVTRLKEFILQVPHSQVTFLAPTAYRVIARKSPRKYFDLYFRSVADCILRWSRRNHQVTPGFSSTLHTWTRSLLYYPHLHTLVAQGGLTEDHKKWVSFQFSKTDIEELRMDFQETMTQGLWKLFDKKKFAFSKSKDRLSHRSNFKGIMDKVKDSDWKIHVSDQDSSVDDVLKKQIPYIQRPPITDSRLVSYADARVTFKTRKNSTVTITADDFLKRFISHILPQRFKSSRHYGLYSNRGRSKMLPQAHSLTNDMYLDSRQTSESLWKADSWQDVMKISSGHDPNKCPRCGKSTMISIEVPDVKTQGLQVHAEQNKEFRYGQLQLITDTS